ncbi:hypothetical protein PENTCL1PPCAC_21472, partial [Pristionchus entomophagus]
TLRPPRVVLVPRSPNSIHNHQLMARIKHPFWMNQMRCQPRSGAKYKVHNISQSVFIVINQCLKRTITWIIHPFWIFR